MQQAKALVASGMKKVGYQYINIDEGWWLGERDQSGNIVVDAKQWPALQTGEQPGDISNIVRFIHGLGLKAGIYTDAGEAGCSFYGPDLGPPMPHTGSEGHYDQDFLQFARWGFDYVKVDWCGGHKDGKPSLDPAVQYAAAARAIERAEKITGHRLFYSICDWGNNSPWTWAPGIGGIAGDIWRTSGDIVPPIVANTPNSGRTASFAKVLDNFDQGIHPQAQHTGFYNDPDMMVVGMQGLSDEQNRVHMSLWAISGAPLIVGADLAKLDQATLGTLTNPEIIAVDQDSFGVQAIKVDEPLPGLQVWAKPLATSGEHAVLLLNRTAAPAQIDVGWDKIGLDPSASATVRDLWGGKDVGSYLSRYTSTIPASDAVMLIIRGTDGKATRYQAASSANELSGGAAPERCKSCSSGRSVTIGGDKTVTFKIAPIKGAAYIQISYINRNQGPLTAELSVNGEIPTNILFPPTEDGEEVGAIRIAVEPTPALRENTLTFSSPGTPGPVLESISVLAGAH
ncbi:MAG: alpha-galactosidase D [Terriglobia bacterium]